jgi:hypothetical protein
MSMRGWSMGLAATAATMVACNGGSGSKPVADAGPQTSNATTSHPAGSGSSSASTSKANSTGMGAPDAGGDAALASATLSSATMANVGRKGETLLFTIQGADPSAQTSEVHVKLFDSSDAPVKAFDTDWDGVADSAETRLHFDQSMLGQKTFTQTITLPGFFAGAPTIASAEIALSDAQGRLSAPATVTLQAQAAAALGGACDVNEVANRCTLGLVCAGSPATCQAGVAPTLTQVAYYGGSNPVEIFAGNDPDEDIASITVNFMDYSGNPVKVDLGDGTPVSTTTLDARSATGKAFVFANYPASGFTSLVPKISAMPTDTFGRSGIAVTATVAAQPVKANGQACDPAGIAGCAQGSACSPGVTGATNTCGAVGTLQTAKCTAAPQAATSGVLAAWGVAQGTSLWDPPSGCTFATEVNRPEALVSLKLTSPVSTLTVSTATPETDFDTVLYVLPSCATNSSQALGCNDDTQGFSSTVTLTNVAAGTYVIVVDSANPQGGHFGLTVSTQ